MKYYFGIENNYVELDKYKELNTQLQSFIKDGYILGNGILSVPEERQFLIKGQTYTIGDASITAENTGWYCPSQLAGDKYFVHKGQLKKKEVIDWSAIVTKININVPKEGDGNPFYTISPKFYNDKELKEQLFTKGIGALKIGDVKYENNIFILSNINVMAMIENYYALYILNRAK